MTESKVDSFWNDIKHELATYKWKYLKQVELDLS